MKIHGRLPRLTSEPGSNSIGATLALCLKDALESQNLPLTADSFRFLIEAGPHVDEIGVSLLRNLLSLELPPRGVALQNINSISLSSPPPSPPVSTYSGP